MFYFWCCLFLIHSLDCIIVTNTHISPKRVPKHDHVFYFYEVGTLVSDTIPFMYLFLSVCFSLCCSTKLKGFFILSSECGFLIRSSVTSIEINFIFCLKSFTLWGEMTKIDLCVLSIHFMELKRWRKTPQIGPIRTHLEKPRIIQKGILKI